MRKKKVLKRIKFYSLFTLLKMARLILHSSKSVINLIYHKIDWRDYRKNLSKVDPKAKKWVRYNSWFGEDEYMTNFAFQTHRILVEFEGVDPKSRKYYDEIDIRIYNRFKHRIKRYYSTNN